jgi:DNA modification methylase
VNTHHIILGDCIEGMKTLSDKCVQTCITSPPYFGLRSYLPDGVKLRDDLTSEQIEYILNELKNRGIDHISE